MSTAAKTIFLPSYSHWAFPSYRERVRKADYQKLLLSGSTFRNGLLCEWKGKHVGAGIYEVWLEEKK